MNLIRCDMTQRQLLQAISSIFDPLGNATPVTIRLRMILQTVWRSGKTWDEPLTAEMFPSLKQIASELVCLQPLAIPRQYFISDKQSVDLHVFCDASYAAYVLLPTLFSIKVIQLVLFSFSEKLESLPLNSKLLRNLNCKLLFWDHVSQNLSVVSIASLCLVLCFGPIVVLFCNGYTVPLIDSKFSLPTEWPKFLKHLSPANGDTCLEF